MRLVMRLNATIVRFCSRCQKELTDPASLEAGVGPQCRNRDNHLYAKAIEANLPLLGASGSWDACRAVASRAL